MFKTYQKVKKQAWFYPAQLLIVSCPLLQIVYCRVFDWKQTKRTLYGVGIFAGFLNENRQKGHHLGVGICCRVFERKQTKKTPCGSWYMLQGFWMKTEKKDTIWRLVYVAGFLNEKGNHTGVGIYCRVFKWKQTKRSHYWVGTLGENTVSPLSAYVLLKQGFPLKP